VKCIVFKKLELSQININLWDIKKKTIGYYFYQLNEQKVCVFTHIIFLEKEFVLERSTLRKIKLEKVQEP